MKSTSGIRSFFEPRSIAVVGASPDPDKMASIIFTRLQKRVAEGTLRASVYPVNPAHASIGNVRCYSSVSSLPEVPELLVIAVPVRATADIVRDAGRAGVGAAIIIAGGFAEVGDRALEAEILRLARSHGMRVLGPNTMGVLDMESGVDTFFLRPTKRLPDGNEISSVQTPKKGGVVVITQSGHLGEVILEGLTVGGAGIRALVGTGNQLDVSVEDVMDYFVDDEDTKVIALYLEGLKDGRRFMEVASRATRNKPVLVFKSGKTAVGSRATLTHTASLAGEYDSYRAAFRQAGLIEAASVQEFTDCCISLSLLPSSLGSRLLIVTNAGGAGAITADEASRAGLTVNALTANAAARIRATLEDSSLASYASIGNPLDLTASATTDEFANATELGLSLPQFDMAVILPTHQTPAIGHGIAERLADIVRRCGKPVVVCIMGESDFAGSIRGTLASGGVPSYPTPERAVRSLAAVSAYPVLKALAMPPTGLMSRDRVASLRGRRAAGRQSARAILKHYGISEPDSVTVQSEKDLRKARRLSYPVACKLLSPRLVHKRDAGGVILDVGTAELASSVSRLRRLAAKKRLPFEGVLVQEMVEGGLEMILGSTRDQTFGPMVLFGLGGTYTELTREYALAVAPVTKSQAMKLITGTRLSGVLLGYRGGVRVDLDKLAAMVTRFSRILVENPSVDAFEVNPLTASAKGILAVDTRIVLSGTSSHRASAGRFG